MHLLVMAVLGSMVGLGLLCVVASIRGVQLLRWARPSAAAAGIRAEQFSLWLLLAVVAAIAAWGLTGWPVGGLWVFAGTVAFPLTRDRRYGAVDEIDKVEAIATWTEQIRDTMNASAGLQQALIATATHGPLPIADELRDFARRAPRGDLGGALQQLGHDIDHPSSDMVVAGLLAATELDAGRLVPLLSRLASSIRDEAQMRIRIEVGRARVRTSMKIVGVCVAMTALLLLIAGGDLLDGYGSATGQLWLLVVGAVVVAAAWSSRRLGEVPQPDRFVSRRRLA